MSSSEYLLHELAALGDWKQIEILFRIEAVKDVNLRDDEFEGLTPLHWAVRKGKASLRGRYKCCQLLLEHGADPTMRIREGGWTAAHCAAEIGQLEILKLLFDHAAPMLLADDFDACPKDIARIYGHTACIEFLHDVEEGRAKRNLVTLKDEVKDEKNAPAS